MDAGDEGDLPTKQPLCGSGDRFYSCLPALGRVES